MYFCTADDYYVYNTPDNADAYSRNVLLMDVTQLVFSVQASNDAHLLLSTVPGVYTSDTFEVYIGGNGNTQSGIRASPGGSDLVIVVRNNNNRGHNFLDFILFLKYFKS